MNQRELLEAAIAVVLGDLEMANDLVKIFKGTEIDIRELTEKLDVSPSDARKMMYLLQDANLAFQIVRRDEITGMRYVVWRLHEDVAPSFLKRRLGTVKKVLQERKVVEEGGEYYICAADPSHIKLSFDEAAFRTESSFLCSVCGASLIPVDREKAIEKLDKGMDLIDRFMKELDDD